jgi:hypothetical protein
MPAPELLLAKMEIPAINKNKNKRMSVFLNDILLLINLKNKKPINNKSVKYKKTEPHSPPAGEPQIVVLIWKGIRKRKA